MSDEMKQLLEQQDAIYQEIYRGTVVEGTVLKEKSDCYYIDLNYKTDGILYKNEVFDSEEISEGDLIKVFVLKIDKNTGEIQLSKKRVDEISAWENIAVDDIVSIKVLEYNPKGVIASYKGSIRGFIPLSQLDLRYVNEEYLKTFLGKEFEVQVLDVDPKKRRLILSRKAILQKAQEEKRKELLKVIAEGDIFKGVVRDIKNYGLFVDIDGLIGLVHISEISWDRNLNIKDAYKIDQIVEVKVINFNKETERLSLSIKKLEPHPWDEYTSENQVGDIVFGEVKNIKDYGAFVNLYPVVDGFIHISNLSKEFVKNPNDVLKVGEKIEVKIINIDNESRKIELSMILDENSEISPEEDGEEVSENKSNYNDKEILEAEESEINTEE